MQFSISEADLSLRAWRLEDAPFIVPLANNAAVSAALRDQFPFPYTARHADEFLELAITDTTHFAITLRDQPIGGISFVPGRDVDRFTAEIGYWLGEPYWGRGWMTLIVSVFSNWLLGAQAPQPLARLEARVYSFNPASARVLEKAGYQFEGRHRQAVYKRGRFADTLCYAKIRHSTPDQP